MSEKFHGPLRPLAVLAVTGLLAACAPEVGSERFDATAVLTEGYERQAVYDSMTAAMPRFGEYQAGVDREIPMFRIVRKS